MLRRPSINVTALLVAVIHAADCIPHWEGQARGAGDVFEGIDDTLPPGRAAGDLPFPGADVHSLLRDTVRG